MNHILFCKKAVERGNPYDECFICKNRFCEQIYINKNLENKLCCSILHHGYKYWECDKCGETFTDATYFKFCPNCGRKNILESE